MKKENPIIVALDVSDSEQAFKLVKKLGSSVAGFKVGKELFTSAGPEIVRRINASGGWAFLDLKYHDIPNTVAKAVAAATRLGVKMLNVHASGGFEMMRVAVDSAQYVGSQIGDTPLVLGVSMLTSLDDVAVDQIGFAYGAADMVERLAKLAVYAGLGGLVCSPLEVKNLRQIVPAEFQLVTPGIRPAEAGKQDQKRTGTPKQAMDDGANWLVIGRPITEASDPRVAAEAILASLD